MAPMKETKVKQLRRALNEEKSVVPTSGTREPALPTRQSTSQQLASRQAAKNAPSSSSTAKSRAAASLTQVAKSTSSSSVNRKQAVKKAAEPAVASSVSKRGQVAAKKKLPASPQSSQATVRHGTLLSEGNITRTDTITIRASNLTDSSNTHRSIHLSDQHERGSSSPDEDGNDPETHVHQAEPDDVDEYADDFDDYESDFEVDEDEQEDQKVVGTYHRPDGVETKEQKEEIVRQGSCHSEGNLIRDGKPEERHKKRISITSCAQDDGGIIDPDVAEIASAKGQRQQLLSSDSRSKRQRDLLSVIKLNAVTYQIYSQPGISYDVYMRMFGRKNHRQVATQTSERQDQSIQSEMYLMKDNWMQHPFYCYSSQQDKPLYHSNTTRAPVPCDPFRLLSFLTRCQKILNILIKDSSTRNQTPHFPDSALRTKSARRVMKLPAGSEKFCAQFHKLIGISSLKKFPLSLIHSSSQLLISVQINPQTDESFLLIWPGSSACRPDHVLHARSHVTCCYWAGDDRVVAGTRDGSLLLWDWHEEERSGSRIDVESGFFVPREPAFASSCVTSLDVHQSCIVSIDGMDGSNESDNPDQGCSRRIVAVDEQALISFWIVEVVVVKQSAEMAEGMFPGSKCKLLLQATTQIDHSSGVTCLRSAPDEAGGCFFVGTDTGLIHQTSQSYDARSPISYSQIRDSAETALSAVSSISLNPVQGNLFVASFADGTISLFRRRGSQSGGTHLMTWDSTDTQISAAITVHWLPSSASAFVALSASSSLVFWDLDTCICSPLFKYQLTKVRCMSMTDEKDAGIAFGTEDGNMEIMTLTPDFRTQKDLTHLIEKLMNEENIIHD